MSLILIATVLIFLGLAIPDVADSFQNYVNKRNNGLRRRPKGDSVLRTALEVSEESRTAKSPVSAQRPRGKRKINKE
ncbi:hypothetical protein H1S01_17440 [Heliobacterium chlorum]|uniref:Uncharacterized protein n=1 Tax=Heliobacterium chlorum TaxID=2698 RepID=A0ABR7T876_HELCL|nr:hypothetical protein [Heliobacterium chlorum]MBC9786248.1 hypothetical protein [Heliobacterium chlorum]